MMILRPSLRLHYRTAKKLHVQQYLSAMALSDDDNHLLEEMANKFEVSKSMMLLRLLELKLTKT